MPSISIPAAIGSVVAGGLSSVGIGAATAGVLGSVAGTALTGAGLGAATAALTGGKVLKGAGYGALAGGALGAGSAALSAFAPETAGMLGSGNITGALNGMFGSGAAPGAAEASAVSDAAYGVPSAASSTGALGSAAASGSGISGALGQAGKVASLLSGFGTPSKPNYGALPGPGQNSATLGPLWNAPAVNSGYINRTPNNPMAGQPMQNWYTYGQRPEQSFFNNNAITFPGGNTGALTGAAQGAQSGLPSNVLGPLQMAQGGGVDGEGDGTSDSIPAQLSSGEYVLTAADVSRIGAGSTTAGVKKLDKMRAQVARDAGAKKFQGKVKAPLEYLRKAS